MILTIYLIILAYFLAGAAGFYYIGKWKEAGERRKIWVKYISYLAIIHLVFLSIVIYPLMFRYLSILIIFAGFYELFHLYWECKCRKVGLFLFSLFIFGMLAIFYFLFSGEAKELLLFTFLIVSIFDSFSQVTGQLWGRKKLFPSISPGKTLGGLAGGLIIALVSSLIIRNLVGGVVIHALGLASGIILFAFLGDMASSYYKRQYNAKDFSNLIPGHGGFLDRFDSLLAAGAWVAVYGMIYHLITI